MSYTDYTKKIYGRNIKKRFENFNYYTILLAENFRINEVAEELVKLGHKVGILTGYPNYPKGEVYPEFKKDYKKFSQYKGIKIIRASILSRKKNNN